MLLILIYYYLCIVVLTQKLIKINENKTNILNYFISEVIYVSISNHFLKQYDWFIIIITFKLNTLIEYIKNLCIEIVKAKYLTTKTLNNKYNFRFKEIKTIHRKQ